MKTYFTFTIQVFKDKTPQGALTEYAEVEVIADNEEEALKKARQVLVRPDYTYRVKMVHNYQLVEHEK